MSDSQFKPGDVVQLKSGGPEMTVQEVNGDDIFCTWFVKDERKYEEFKPYLLKRPSQTPLTGQSTRV